MDSSTFQLKVFLFLLAERFSENFAHELLEEDKRGYYRSPGLGEGAGTPQTRAWLLAREQGSRPDSPDGNLGQLRYVLPQWDS